MVRDLFLIADHLDVHSAPQLKAALAAAEGVEPDLAKLVPADFQDQVSPHLLKMAVTRTPVRSQRTGASMNDLLQSSPGSEWSGDFTRKMLVTSVGGFNYAVLFVCLQGLYISIHFTETKPARDIFDAIEALRVFVAGLGMPGVQLTRVNFDSDTAGAVAGRGEDLQDNAIARAYKAAHPDIDLTRSPAYTQPRNAVENRVRVLNLYVVKILAKASAGLPFWTGAMRLARKQMIACRPRDRRYRTDVQRRRSNSYTGGNRTCPAGPQDR